MIWQSRNYSPSRERLRRVKERAKLKRVETLLDPAMLARVEVLRVRPAGSPRPSRRDMMAYVVSLGVTRAETIARAAVKSQAAHRATQAAKAMKQAINGGAW